METRRVDNIVFHGLNDCVRRAPMENKDKDILVREKVPPAECASPELCRLTLTSTTSRWDRGRARLRRGLPAAGVVEERGRKRCEGSAFLTPTASNIEIHHTR